MASIKIDRCLIPMPHVSLLFAWSTATGIEREVSESDYLDAVGIMPRASKSPLITHLASLDAASTQMA